MSRALFHPRYVLAALALSFFLLALHSGMTALYIAASYTTAILVTARLLSLRALSGIGATGVRIGDGIAGRPVAVEIELLHQGRIPRYAIRVALVLETPSGRRVIPAAVVTRIGGGGHARLSLSFTPEVRGMHRLAGVALASGFPFGIFEGKGEIPLDLSFLVFPDPFPIDRFPCAPHLPTPATPFEAQHPGSAEFIGVRDYRPGDPLRRIHWPSTARLGRLVVKEFVENADMEIMILIDMPSPGDDLEAAVRVAAGWVRLGAQKGYPIGLATAQAFYPARRGTRQERQLFRALALFSPEGGADPFSRAARSGGLSRGTLLLRLAPLVGLEEARRFEGVARGIGCHPFQLLFAASSRRGEASSSGTLPFRGLVVTPDDRLPDRLRMGMPRGSFPRRVS
ncbi:MAG: DUF58 domain-containing protein [Deltaproteobacteria bacterium]|nr:MAG: DUF58 domain-containing protein [Deltaproteobacteria bacterium]